MSEVELEPGALALLERERETDPEAGVKVLTARLTAAGWAADCKRVRSALRANSLASQGASSSTDSGPSTESGVKITGQSARVARAVDRVPANARTEDALTLWIISKAYWLVACIGQTELPNVTL